MTKTRRKIVLAEQELLDVVSELNALADRQVDVARAANRDLDRLYKHNRKMEETADASLTRRLQEALEAEIVPAIELHAGVGILPIEFDHEVIKKALVGLKLETLKKLASRNAAPISGTAESIASAIAERYKWNRAEIARLILEVDVEPIRERAHLERIYPLGDAPSLEYVSERLEAVLGHYIRTGVARWFVFESLDRAADRIVLRGTLRAFRADATRVESGPTVVAATRPEHTIELELDTGPLLRVRGASRGESTAGVRALEAAARLSLSDELGLAGNVSDEPEQVVLAPASLFMLDLLNSRLADAGLHNKNMTVVQFEIDGDDADRGRSDAKPRLKAVRFEGAHLLDSAAACKLLADEGRALVDMSFTTDSAPRQDGEVGRYPVRISIERDHVFVMTGFGVLPAGSFVIQSAVVDAVSDELVNGIANIESLRQLARRIKARASETGPIEEADILREDSDLGEDD